MPSLIGNMITPAISAFFRQLTLILAFVGLIGPVLAQHTPVSNIRLLNVSPSELNFGLSVRHETSLHVRILPVSSWSGTTIRLCNCSANQDPDKMPLYLVNGIVVRDLRSLKPADIQEITVLKGVKAQQKYSAIGKNGVVEITMKRPALTKTDASQVPENN